MATFLESCDIPSLEKIGHIFRILSRHIITGIDDGRYQTSLIHVVKKGVVRIENWYTRSLGRNASFEEIYKSLKLTPLHATLFELAHKQSDHMMVANYLSLENIREKYKILRPDTAMGANFTTLFIYYYNASMLLFEEAQYKEAFQYITIALVACPWIRSTKVLARYVLTLLASLNERVIEGQLSLNTGENINLLEFESSYIPTFIRGQILDLLSNKLKYGALYGDSGTELPKLISFFQSDTYNDGRATPINFFEHLKFALPEFIQKLGLETEIYALLNSHRELNFLNMPEFYLSADSSTVEQYDRDLKYLTDIFDTLIECSEKKGEPFKSDIEDDSDKKAKKAASIIDSSILETPPSSFRGHHPSIIGIETPEEPSSVEGTANAKEALLSKRLMGGEKGKRLPSSLSHSNASAKTEKPVNKVPIKIVEMEDQEMKNFSRKFICDLILNRRLPTAQIEECINNGNDKEAAYWIYFSPRDVFVSRENESKKSDKTDEDDTTELLGVQIENLSKKLKKVGQVSRIIESLGLNDMVEKNQTLNAAVGIASSKKSSGSSSTYIEGTTPHAPKFEHGSMPRASEYFGSIRESFSENLMMGDVIGREVNGYNNPSAKTSVAARKFTYYIGKELAQYTDNPEMFSSGSFKKKKKSRVDAENKDNEEGEEEQSKDDIEDDNEKMKSSVERLSLRRSYRQMAEEDEDGGGSSKLESAKEEDVGSSAEDEIEYDEDHQDEDEDDKDDDEDEEDDDDENDDDESEDDDDKDYVPKGLTKPKSAGSIDSNNSSTNRIRRGHIPANVLNSDFSDSDNTNRDDDSIIQKLEKDESRGDDDEDEDEDDEVMDVDEDDDKK